MPAGVSHSLDFLYHLDDEDIQLAGTGLMAAITATYLAERSAQSQICQHTLSRLPTSHPDN